MRMDCLSVFRRQLQPGDSLFRPSINCINLLYHIASRAARKIFSARLRLFSARLRLANLMICDIISAGALIILNFTSFFLAARAATEKHDELYHKPSGLMI